MSGVVTLRVLLSMSVVIPPIGIAALFKGDEPVESACKFVVLIYNGSAEILPASCNGRTEKRENGKTGERSSG
jgi:hypothetical protein